MTSLDAASNASILGSRVLYFYSESEASAARRYARPVPLDAQARAIVVNYRSATQKQAFEKRLFQSFFCLM